MLERRRVESLRRRKLVTQQTRAFRRPQKGITRLRDHCFYRLRLLSRNLPYSRHQGFSSEPPLTYSPKRRVQSADCRGVSKSGRYFPMPRLCSPLCGLLRERRASGPNSRRTKMKMNTSSCLPSGPIKGINLHWYCMPRRGGSREGGSPAWQGGRKGPLMKCSECLLSMSTTQYATRRLYSAGRR